MPTAQDRPLRRDAQLNRDRIVSAAGEVFARRGLAGTFHNVADEAGVGLGTVYRRFPTKEQLVEAVYRQHLAGLVATAEAALRAPTGWDGLVDVLTTAARLHASDQGLRDVALARGHRPEAFREFGDRMEPLLRDLVERARTEGSLRPDVTAEDLPVVMAMISELALHADPVRPGLHTRYLALVLDGLRAPATTPLGDPLTRTELDAVAENWLPALEPREDAG
ncbi:TetR/AcrR family transcriptional regulator [Actinosynnema pretiosum subsp. pretiosum]|uniref:Transcriptional regulator, TetR family n=2 Tax=Actinosynnema TaxID=40566 RepID=C6WMT4_ACTMD|nr:TetR/AcrR family transcriptional regulator [Actinosynnema mirum]ACU38447.1 transcriptional regulator, TetR family [Actinosynnema mirum DSM 43827]AXX31994.1 Transcriptional regulator, TetR family [Actinosynnema pretiosum subsp. pretiosum]QUF04033.1 TetR/AcrR family transcriptional regulator [Actinosynnema pretiosum subsp. pretiosum]